MSIFSLGKSSTKSKTKSWEDYSRQAPAWQLPYQQGGLGFAQDIYNRGPTNPVLTGGRQNLLDLYRSNVPDLANTYEALSANLSPGLETAYGAYSDLLNPQEGYFDQFSVARELDPNVINSAINNPILNEQISAGTADIQNAYDRNLAAVKAGAAAGGGTGSSWRALAQGDALESMGRNVANLTSGLRGQAYGYGVDAANRANAAQNAAQMRAWMQEAADLQRRGGVAGALGSLGEYGVGLGRDALGFLENAGQGIVGIGEDMVADPWNTLREYWNIVGNPLGEEGSATGESKTKGKRSGFSLSFGGG